MVSCFFGFPRHRHYLMSTAVHPFSGPRVLGVPIVRIGFEQLVGHRIGLLCAGSIRLAATRAVVHLHSVCKTKRGVTITCGEVSTVQTIVGLLPRRLEARYTVLYDTRDRDRTKTCCTGLRKAYLPGPVAFVAYACFIKISVSRQFRLLSISSVGRVCAVLSPRGVLRVTNQYERPRNLCSRAVVCGSSSGLGRHCAMCGGGGLLYLTSRLYGVCGTAIGVCRGFGNMLACDFLDSVRSLVHRSGRAFCKDAPIDLVQGDVRKGCIVSCFGVSTLIRFMQLQRSVCLGPSNLVRTLKGAYHIIS